MSGKPWYPWYIGDARAKMARLTLEQKGAYRELLDEYYASGEPLPAGLDELYRIAGAHTESERASVDVVVRRFMPVGPDGLRHNKRTDTELTRQAHLHDEQSRKGKIRASGPRDERGRLLPPAEIQPKHQPEYPAETPAEIQPPQPQPQPQVQPELQSSTAKSKSIRASRSPDGVKTLTDLGVDEQHAKDWLAVRKAKRAPLTDTALHDLQREAGKAGITVAEAVAVCAARSWQGFKASWDWQGKGNGTNGRETVAEHNERARQEFLARQAKTIEGETLENN